MKNVSWMLLTVLLVSTFALVFNARLASAQTEVVYINRDGSVVPSSAPISSPDNITYTFTANISYPTYDAIEVFRSNIVINGNGYTLRSQGSQSGYYGLSFWGVSNATVKNVNVQNSYIGIYLYYSSNNTILWNNVTTNYGGIWLDSSSNYNVVSGNNATENSEGIVLSSSSNYNVVSGNDATTSIIGISVETSSNNTVSGNIASANGYLGITLDSSNWNIITGNNITTNQYLGLVLYNDASNNTLYHNNIVENNLQVSINPPPLAGGGTPALGNAWNGTYLSGGNYWSDYDGTDLFSGPYQNITGSDGIGDSPYTIDPNNTDNYPLMQPYPAHNIAVNNLTATPTAVRKGYCCFIDLTVANIGDFDETFNVTVYANMTITANVMTIATFATVILNGHDSAMLTFIWDTSGFEPGNYILSAFASPVPGETNVADNAFVTSPMQIVPLMSGGGEANGMKCPSFSERA